MSEKNNNKNELPIISKVAVESVNVSITMHCFTEDGKYLGMQKTREKPTMLKDLDEEALLVFEKQINEWLNSSGLERTEITCKT